MLSNKDFKNIIKNTNLFAFDLIIKNNNDEVLLAKRNNKPAQGMYFVPGGRVFKNENLNDAFNRILNQEIGLKISDFKNIFYKGLYNHIYKDNVYGDTRFNTHYIVYAIELQLKKNINIFLDNQHSDYKFINIKDLLMDVDVHQYVKNYFIDNPNNKFNIVL